MIRSVFFLAPTVKFYGLPRQAKFAVRSAYLVVGLGFVVTDEVVRRVGLPSAITGKALDTFFGPEDGDYEVVDLTPPPPPTH